ncbi:MAG: hypothetical protein B6U76_07260 [Desulfurococcales archaeon ex4484_217_2]|nr:MAG: hypothetical protein B6U76_07260 [Desulfurococcales archaeon ex4484_217_2]
MGALIGSQVFPRTVTKSITKIETKTLLSTITKTKTISKETTIFATKTTTLTLTKTLTLTLTKKITFTKTVPSWNYVGTIIYANEPFILNPGEHRVDVVHIQEYYGVNIQVNASSDVSIYVFNITNYALWLHRENVSAVYAKTSREINVTFTVPSSGYYVIVLENTGKQSIMVMHYKVVILGRIVKGL